MPDEALVLLSLALGVALAAAALLTLRRSGSVAAATREASASRQALRGFAARADGDLGPILTQIDGVRRRLVEPSAVSEELQAALLRVEELAEEARSLTVVPGHSGAKAALVEDVERAGRALDMIDHGCVILAQPRGRGRELEAQTAIKRGYLNLLHAREALARHAVDVTAGTGGGRRDLGRAPD